uniref:Farnesyl pyrophosphate synthase n=2 Tax=Panagrellus redivivus TaxID=6233 RepID=A0A7E4VXV5_PANRE
MTLFANSAAPVQRLLLHTVPSLSSITGRHLSVSRRGVLPLHVVCMAPDLTTTSSPRFLGTAAAVAESNRPCATESGNEDASIMSSSPEQNPVDAVAVMDYFDSNLDSVTGRLRDDFAASFYQNLGPNEREILSKRFRNFFNHSVYGGKMTRSRLSFGVYNSLCRNISPADAQSALTVVLSIELLQATFLVIDDVMDGGETRRGKPCWHRMPEVGLTALNHALRLQNFVNISIMNAIPNHKNVGPILKTVWETIQISSDGQELDGLSASSENCTFDRYRQIVANKTSRYTFYYPMAVALLLADETAHLNEVLKISEAFGYFFQAQDDLLDFLDNDTASGKTCCDIREGKCTWFACKTIEKLANSPDKLDTFWKCYGSSDPSNVTRAREIMLECDLLADFRLFERDAIAKLNTQIAEFPLPAVRPALRIILQGLIGRKK